MGRAGLDWRDDGRVLIGPLSVCLSHLCHPARTRDGEGRWREAEVEREGAKRPKGRASKRQGRSRKMQNEQARAKEQERWSEKEQNVFWQEGSSKPKQCSCNNSRMFIAATTALCSAPVPQKHLPVHFHFRTVL